MSNVRGDDRVTRRVVRAPGFAQSVAALGGSPEVRELVKALVNRLERPPANVPRVHALETRVIKTRSYGSYPAVRLLYVIAGETVYLVEVGFYDELRE